MEEEQKSKATSVPDSPEEDFHQSVTTTDIFFEALQRAQGKTFPENAEISDEAKAFYRGDLKAPEPEPEEESHTSCLCEPGECAGCDWIRENIPEN